MENRIRISCVSYLNSLPFLFGLRNSQLISKVELILDNPAECARKLINNEADIGLVPVAAIPDLPGCEIISDFGIGADGEVSSVLLLSRVPVNELDTILLDYQSVTSVNLVKILASQFWKINPEYSQTKPGYEECIEDNTGAVIIGDRALKLKGNYQYVYDLSAAWKEFTGLPFVFACWVSNRKLDPDFILEFNQALEFGIQHIDQVIDNLRKEDKFIEGTDEYLRDKLKFYLNENAKKGRDLFLKYLKTPSQELIRGTT